jgi:hypothetical protein
VGKLQIGRFERLSARTYGIKGPGALVDLDETVLGVLQLERQAGMEAHFIQGWDTFGTHLVMGPGGAVNFNWVCLSNPVGSGRIAVFDWYQRRRPLNTAVFLTLGIPPGFNVADVGTPLDTRIPRARQPALSFRSFVTNISTFGTQVGISSSLEKQETPVVIAEDGTLCIRTGLVNEDFEISLRWAEREAQPFEQ